MNGLIMDENYLMRNEMADWEDMCNSPWTVKGLDLGRDDHYGISIDNDFIKEIVEKAVKELLEEEKTKPVMIEKYHMKHK